MTHQGFVIAVIAIACGTGIVVVFMCLIFSLITRKKKRREQGISEDDGEMVQDLFHGLQRMESRIENLETILLRREKARDFEQKL